MRIRPLFYPVLCFLLQLSMRAHAQPAPDAPPAEAPPAPPPPAEAPAAPSAPPVAKEPSAEEVGEGEDPSRPPPKGKGVIWGVVTDTKLHEPLIEVQVSAIGTKFKGLTDIDGRYRLELPPGTYNLRFFYEAHQPVRIDKVRVAAGQVAKVDAELTPEETAAEVTEVETEADRAALEGQILARQKSASVGDGIGRAEIAKTPDSNAAQAAQRVVGANIVGGRFVYVRGLGERYSNATLNGAPLPSPEPDRAAVPLDLFPAQAIDGITINKTFVPHMPGDFAGGNLAIETRKIPTEFLFNASVGLGYNTQSTFRDRLDHRGSSTDWLGFDGGTRAMPDGLPNYRLSQTGEKPGGGTVSDAERVQWGRAMNSYMSTTESGTPPNHSVAVVAGKGFRLSENQRIGAIAALTYGRSYEMIRDGLVRDFIKSRTDPRPRQVEPKLEYKAFQGADLVRWGALGSISYEPHPNHRLTILGFRSQLSDDVTNIWNGQIVDEPFRTHRATRLTFVSRRLDLGQLSGDHKFPELEFANLHWTFSLGNAVRDEPDTRDVVYIFRPPPDRWRFKTAADSGRHFWSEQDESSIAGSLDWTQPLDRRDDPTKVRFGGLVSLKQRDFAARRFNYEELDPTAPVLFCDGATFRRSCPDALFTADNVGSAGPPLTGQLSFTESTRPDDAYTADLDVLAAYVEAEVGLTRDVRLIFGERVEHTVQTVVPQNQFSAGNFVAPQQADLNSTDNLPSASLAYAVTKRSKLRAAITRTLARPQVRELAPFAFTDYFSGRENGGNPALVLTKITNADLRFETFPTLREIAAFSFFYKNFKDPIEPIIKPGGSTNIGSFVNTAGADVLGLELEGRKTLGFLARVLDDFTVIANLTLAYSRIHIDEPFMTNKSRPLAQQAPYVLNLAFDYTHEGTGIRILYNVVGARIVDVGVDGLEDIYEQPRHVIDLTASQDFLDHFQAKLAVRNLFNTPVRQTIGSEDREERLTRRYTTGAVYTISMAYNY